MAEPVPVGDLVTAVSNALHGDRSRLGAMVADARQRTEARALDSLMPRTPEAVPAEPMPAPVARAIRRLTAADDELAKKVAALQDQSDQALLRLVDSLAALRRQMREAARGGQVIAAVAPGAATTAPRTSDVLVRRAAAHRKPMQRARQLRQAREARLLAARMQIQNVTSVVNTLQAAAYGQKGRLLATNNVLLAANQLFWTLLDPVLQGVGVLDTATATALAAFAPVGSLLSGQILLGDRQHVRFVSGVTVVAAAGVARESLRGLVAEGLWPAFRERVGVPVTATAVDAEGRAVSGVAARVVEGTVEMRLPVHVALLIAVPAAVPAWPIRVAWTVDTGADVG